MPMQMPKKFLPLIIAAVAAIVAVVLISNLLQQQQEDLRQQVQNQRSNSVTIVVATQDIPGDTVLKESMLKEVQVNRNQMQPKAATSIDRIVDKIAIAPITKGEQILLNKIGLGQESASLSMKIPPGKRAITIPVDNISSVGGMIRPGDHVDVVGMVPVPAMGPDGKQITQMTTMPLFQDVLVLAVGQDFASGAKKEERAATVITFALGPQEANLIAFVQEQGKVRLVLRSPGDNSQQPVAPASWDMLFRTVMPDMYRQRETPEDAGPPKKTVEIYRGMQKEVKTLE